jgi:copper(I)-binding protein
MAFATGTVVAAVAHDYKLGALEIVHPHIPATASSTAGGYLTIINTGTEADTLIGVSTGFSKSAMLHETTVDAAGVARMTHLEALPIGPGATVTLEAGALHVMFIGVTGPLTEGQMLPATLTFEKAGSIEVEFKIEAKGAVHDHGTEATPSN